MREGHSPYPDPDAELTLDRSNDPPTLFSALESPKPGVYTVGRLQKEHQPWTHCSVCMGPPLPGSITQAQVFHRHTTFNTTGRTSRKWLTPKSAKKREGITEDCLTCS